MALKVVRIKGSPYRYLRGTVRKQYIYETTGTQDDEAAEAIRIQKEKQLLDRSIYGEKSTRTFAAAALAYMESPGSSEREQRFIFPLVDEFGPAMLGDITQSRLDGYIGKRYKGRSPATVLRNVITPLSTILNFASKRKWCEPPKFDRPKQPRGRRRWATYDEAQRFLNECSPHIQRLALFLLLTGARMGEALSLDWEDVDLDRAWCVFRNTKRKGEDRGVPLHPAVLKMLGKKGAGPVFLTHRGKPYAVRPEGGGQIKTAWAAALKRASVTDLRRHDLRHCFSTWLTMAGVHEQVRDELMGHASTDMGRRYSHVPRASLEAAVARLPEITISATRAKKGEKLGKRKLQRATFRVVPRVFA